MLIKSRIFNTKSEKNEVQQQIIQHVVHVFFKQAVIDTHGFKKNSNRDFTTGDNVSGPFIPIDTVSFVP